MIILPDLHSIYLFFIASLFLCLVPGPAVLYIVAKSIEQGLKAGIISVMGISIGTLVHVIATGVGVSAILMASATAFLVIKYLGAFYLIYLSFTKFFGKSNNQNPENKPHKLSKSKTLIDGIVVNILNPKTALFFFAFLPQFVSTEKGGVTFQIIFLGMIFVVLAFFTDSVYAIIAGKMAQWVKKSKMYGFIQKYVTGSVYFFLGILTLTLTPESKK